MDQNFEQNYGQLVIRTTSSDGAVPIKDATVAVRLLTEDGPRIIAVLITNESGETPVVIIPTPPPELSLEPNSNVRPYAVVDTEVTAFGYYTTANLSVPVFPGVTSVQNVNMIPLSEYEQNGTPPPQIIVFESEAPSL